MVASPSPRPPFRDPGFAPCRLEIEHRPGGEMVLTNPTPFSTAFQTTTAALGHWAAAAPDRIWLAERSGEGWRTATFREAWQQVRALAGGLVGLGLGPGPLLVLSHNRIDNALVIYAAMSQALPVAPVSVQYGLAGANPARLAHAVRLLRPSAVYVEDAALFATALAAPELAGLRVIAAANARPGDISLAELARAAPAPPTARPDDHAKYLLTSGSTGLPKAVIATHWTTASNAAQVTACFADPEPPVLVNAAPWNHVLGSHGIMQYVLHRGGTIYIDGGQPTAERFGETLRNLREISPTYHHMVPAGWMLLAEELDKDPALARRLFERVGMLQYGGAAMGQAVADRIEAAAVRAVGQRITFGSGYGSTEVSTCCNIHWLNDQMGLIGLPAPGTAMRLVPQDGKLDCRVKGPQVTPGYLGRPDLTEAAFDEEGFYRLGDAVRPADPQDLTRGFVFDGRLAENFKLASGTFVAVGDLRIGAISAIGGAVTDAVVCGEGRAGVGLLLYPNPSADRDAIITAVRAGLQAFNAKASGGAGRVARALVLAEGPDAASGEITDKGYIAQPLARSRRAAAIEQLFADPPPREVLVLD